MPGAEDVADHEHGQHRPRVIAGRSGVACAPGRRRRSSWRCSWTLPYPGRHAAMTHRPLRPPHLRLDGHGPAHDVSPARAHRSTSTSASSAAGSSACSRPTCSSAAGARVAVLEAARVATGVTGYTTAKVTALHGLIYDQVRSHFGERGRAPLRRGEHRRAGADRRRAPRGDRLRLPPPPRVHLRRGLGRRSTPLRKEVDAARRRRACTPSS